MNVTFEKGMAKHSSNNDNLKTIKIDYACEWPLEILIDQQTIA